MSTTLEVNEKTGQIIEPEIEDGDVDENKDDQEAEHRTDDDDPEAVAALTPEEIEKRGKLLDKETKRHTDAVSRILGEDAQALILCELCEDEIQGFRWPQIMEGDPREPLYAMLGNGAPEALKEADDAKLCELCNGHGETLTGSKRQDALTKLCRGCSGTGWVNVNYTTTTLPPPPTGSNGASEHTPEIAPLPNEDYMGRPIGHPNYGKFTQYMTPTEIERDKLDGYLSA